MAQVQKKEAEKLGAQGHSQLCSDLEASLGGPTPPILPLVTKKIKVEGKEEAVQS